MPLVAPKPPKVPKAPKPQTKPLSRTGGAAGGQFEALHPRGRGGLWIVKHGDGYASTGPDQTTAQLQQRLNQLGFKVPVDGKYGPATTAAVQTFQKRYGLTPSMGVDAATMEFMQNPPTQTLDQIQRTKGIGRYSKSAIAARAKKATSSSSSSSSSTKKITAAQANADTTVAGETKGVIAAGQLASQQTHEAGQDTTMHDARHDAAQAQAAAAVAQTLAKEAKAAAVDGSAQARKDARSAARTARTAQKNARGALKAVKALKKQLEQEKAQRIKRAQAPLAGEVAVLARGKTHATGGGSGPGNKLTPPIRRGGTPKVSGGAANVQVATSAELPTRQPDLEEDTGIGGNGVADTTTVAFGYGGAPSMSIPDGRDTIPDADRPIWTRTGVRVEPDLEIPDGRTDTPEPTDDLAIPDGRDIKPDVMSLLLAEAVAARKAATTGQEFTRALAREQVLRARLAEGWNDALHPRGRGGKWVDVLNKLMGGSGAPTRLHIAHLDDKGDDYLNARLHPDSDATDGERKIRDIQRRRAAKARRVVGPNRTLLQRTMGNDRRIRQVYVSGLAHAMTQAADTILDGRDYVPAVTALAEAIIARKAATNGAEFTRVLAREQILRARLAEAYEARLHPRGRGGKWVDVLGKLKGAEVNKPVELGHGFVGFKMSTGSYAAGNGRVFEHDRDPEQVARVVGGHLDQAAERKAAGDAAVRGLSPEAAAIFTHEHSLRGDPEGMPERSEMYQQVYSMDPKGYVRDVFSSGLSPEGRTEAHQILNDSKAQDQRNKVAPYFDLSKPHEMVSVHALRPTKTDPESSYQNAIKRMDTAAQGGMDKRKPLTAQVGGDGSLLLVDGHATLEALKRKGITHAPVQINPRASNLNPATPKDAIREQTRLDRAAIEIEKQQRARSPK